ncbi:thioesterase family protein [Vagococcus hydrophili]|uniref:Thioesterase family protein n=1 Tax=Vagococcus hydrophili TaxID=2714947 RepID=A0A6G8AW58_9ENTE|nr:thioesterase family protein [Vagococcus hydrophili]QIL49294.1 thioesterase family protein [Vagococcus hydrophili]
MILEKEYTVTSNQTALNMGSGTLEVLATPSGLAMAENTCMLLSDSLTTDEETTVGTEINFKHIKASKVDAVIKVVAEIMKHEGKKVSFTFEMFDNDVLVGKGNHTRYIVNTSEFLSHIK